MKPVISIIFAMLMLAMLPCMNAVAEDGATTNDVYELIIKAVPVVQELGDAGLAAFNDPKGEFVYKDAYVIVLDCSTMKMVAHPNPKVIGLSLDGVDKNPDPAKVKHQGREMCQLSKNPNGGWLQYYWTNLGSDEIVRKVGFAIGVSGTNYALVSVISDETSNVDELNASLK